jgi:hypothetical protein
MGLRPRRWPPESWPDPFTFGITGPSFGDVWRCVQYAHHVRHVHQVQVRLYTHWHGWPGKDFSEEPLADRTALAHEIASVLAWPPSFEIVTAVALEEVICLLGLWPWHFPHVPTRVRWRGWTRGRCKGIAYQLDGDWAGDKKNPPAQDFPRLLSLAAEGQLVRLGKPLTVQECVEAAAACDLFFGVDSGMAQLCYAVGLPVFLIGYQQDPLVLFSWHGDKHAIHCDDTADLLHKVRLFLGAAPSAD